MVQIENRGNIKKSPVVVSCFEGFVQYPPKQPVYNRFVVFDDNASYPVFVLSNILSGATGYWSERKGHRALLFGVERLVSRSSLQELVGITNMTA